MARYNKTVPVMYHGQVNKWIIPGPSGRIYEFVPGQVVDVLVEDASFFLENPARSLDFEPPRLPEPAPLILPIGRGRFQSVDIAEPARTEEAVSEAPVSTAEE